MRANEAGCGNRSVHRGVKPGEVASIWVRARVRCFLAARAVGPQGLVIGVDMTPEMVARARENARKSGYENVDFRLSRLPCRRVGHVQLRCSCLAAGFAARCRRLDRWRLGRTDQRRVTCGCYLVLARQDGETADAAVVFDIVAMRRSASMRSGTATSEIARTRAVCEHECHQAVLEDLAAEHRWTGGAGNWETED